MPACPTCATDIPETADVCPRRSTPTPWATDVTRLAFYASRGGEALLGRPILD